MRIKASLILTLFVLFMSLPTIISLVDCKGADSSIVFNMSEEEEEVHKNQFEVFSKNLINNSISSFLSNNSTRKINSEFLLNHDNVSEEIFLPPPEFLFI